jgi:hypothetical protein
MKTDHEGAWRAAQDTPMTVVIRETQDAAEADQLLPSSVLRRLGYRDVPLGGVLDSSLYHSHVIVALVSDVVVGLAAYTSNVGPARVAHTFVVDSQACSDVAPVVHAVLQGLETAVCTEGGSRLCVVLPPLTPLRRCLELAGYRTSQAGPQRVWLEKSLIDGTPPLQSA